MRRKLDETGDATQRSIETAEATLGPADELPLAELETPPEADPQGPQEPPPELGTHPPFEPKESPRPTGRKAKGSDSIAEFLKSLGAAEGAARVEVRRMIRAGGSEHIGNLEVENFNLDDLQAVWGGGKYKLAVHDARGSYLFSRTVQVAGRSKQAKLPDPDEEPLGDRSTLAIVEEMRQELRELRAQMHNPPPAAYDRNPLELMTGLIGVFQASQQPYLDALKEKAKGGADTLEMLELLLRLKDVAAEMNPPSDPMVPVVKELALPLLKGLVPLGAQEAAATNPNPPTAATAAIDAPQRPGWDILLGPWMGHLQGWATKGKNPEMRAVFVVDEMPDEAVQMIGEQLERGEAFLAEFFVLHPEAKPLEGWYREFWGGVAKGLSWEEHDELEEVEVLEVESVPEDVPA